MTKTIESISALKEFAQSLAKQLRPGDCVLLEGELGVGKTTLVAYILSALGYHGVVNSPSFRLIHRYDLKPPVYHIDLYRLESMSAIDQLEIPEILARPGSICFVEWAEKLGENLPDHFIRIHIEYNFNSHQKKSDSAVIPRTITITKKSKKNT